MTTIDIKNDLPSRFYEHTKRQESTAHKLDHAKFK